MTWRGTDDLWGYLKDAILPELKYGQDVPTPPPPGHKSHRNTLSTRFRKYRHLTGIHYLGVSFDEMVNEWTVEHVPDRSVGLLDEDPETGEILTVPSAHKFKINKALPAPVTDFARLWSWVDHFPLQTVQRVLHVIFPQTKNWGFVSANKGNNDDNIFKEFYFTDVLNLPSSDICSNSVVVVCQPPWVLSEEDIWQFTELKSLPIDKSPLRSKERLWAKIWDTCVRRQSTYFILTSYQQWVFGVFSKGFTNAFVSPPLDTRSRHPTVIHAILYWLASALAIEDGYAAPYVPEPVDYVFGDIVVPPSDTSEDTTTMADSLSSWAGKSEEPAPSAHVADVLHPDVSEKGLPCDASDCDRVPHVLPRDPTVTRHMVERWRQTLPTSCAGQGGARDAKPSSSSHGEGFLTLYPPDLGLEYLSDEVALTESSDDRTEVGGTKGHWLTHA